MNFWQSDIIKGMKTPHEDTETEKNGVLCILSMLNLEVIFEGGKESQSVLVELHSSQLWR